MGVNQELSISPSASGVAYLRSLHEDISGDFLAKHFVTPEGEALAKKWLKGLPCVGKEVSLRCSWFDFAINEAIDSGINQIIQIAAGLSTFPWRHADTDKLKYAEFDRPEMVLFKQEVIKNLIAVGCLVSPHCSVLWREVNLSSDRLEPVCRTLSWNFGQPALFALEGISYYLSHDRLADLIREISQISPKGSRIAIDYFHDQTEDLSTLERVMGSIAPAGGEAAWRRINSEKIRSFLKGWEITDDESLAIKSMREGFGKLMDYVSVLSATKII